MSDWHALTVDIARSIIGLSKDMRNRSLRAQAEDRSIGWKNDLLELGCQIYTDYQQALSYRSAVDFDDLIWLALDAIQRDPAYLERLRYRWPYILEDEAQDSTGFKSKFYVPSPARWQLGARRRSQPGHFRNLYNGLSKLSKKTLSRSRASNTAPYPVPAARPTVLSAWRTISSVGPIPLIHV